MLGTHNGSRKVEGELISRLIRADSEAIQVRELLGSWLTLPQNLDSPSSVVVVSAFSSDVLGKGFTTRPAQSFLR